MEPKLFACLTSLILHPGAIIDAGANDGTTTVMLADAFPNHQVVSVEPLHKNVVNIHKLSVGRNVTIVHGGLGASTGMSSYAASAESKGSGLGSQIGKLYERRQRSDTHRVPFRIHTVDELMKTRKLALAHWDVEGSEESVIRGAENTIRRDWPVITVESFPKTFAVEHASLMRLLSHMGYACRQIDEVCGYPFDCRNSVCVAAHEVHTLDRCSNHSSWHVNPLERGHRLT